jgi:hypothetical protein
MVCSHKHCHTFARGPSDSYERAKVIGGQHQKADWALVIKEVIRAMLDAAISSGGCCWGRCLQGPHAQCHLGPDIRASAGLCHAGLGRTDPCGHLRLHPAQQGQGYESMGDLALYQADCVSAARSVLPLSDRGSFAVDGPALCTKEGIEASADDLQHRMVCVGFPE